MTVGGVNLEGLTRYFEGAAVLSWRVIGVSVGYLEQASSGEKYNYGENVSR